MKKLKAVMLVAVIGLSFIFVGNSAVQAGTLSVNESPQIVPVTKRVSRKVYRKGRWVTVTTWKHGKRITKKVWKKGVWVGRKIAGKTKEIVMGPSKRTP